MMDKRCRSCGREFSVVSGKIPTLHEIKIFEFFRDEAEAVSVDTCGSCRSLQDRLNAMEAFPEICCTGMFSAASEGRIEYCSDDETWNVSGCSDCYALCDIKNCPFCGRELTTKQ